MTKIKLYVGLIICMLWFTSADILTQINTSSPYSTFGIGKINSPSDATTIAMGNAGIALKSKNYINILNSASLAYIDSTTFLFNLQGQLGYTKLETNNSQQNNLDANINTLSFAFKINRNWGTAFSLSPYSNISYTIQSEKYILGTEVTYPVVHSGQGGLSQISWMNGIQIMKGLSLGINTSFLWGNTDITETSNYPTINGESISNTKTFQLNTFKLDYSLQYHLALGKDLLSVGSFLKTETQLKSIYQHKIVNDRDIQLLLESKSGTSLLIPAKYGAGLAYTIKSNFLIAADYSYSQWTQSELIIQQGKIRDTRNASIGFEFSPSRNYYRSYLNRMKYRAGLFFNESYLTLNGQDINEIGFSLGLTLPLNKSCLNLAYQYSHSGTKAGGLILEKSNLFTIGLTFNESWFKKPKFK